MTFSPRDFTNSKERRLALEKHLSINLQNIGSFSINEDVASNRNCENMIGAVQIPIGIAGPLRIQDAKLKLHDYFLPLATTEGALIASVSRGCKAILESGGAKIVNKKNGITRAPVFAVKDILQGKEFIENVEKHFDVFKKITENSSKHLKLLGIKSWMVGKNVYIRFSFDSQDAMGMNMATIATSEIVDHLEDKTNIKCIAISGNMCVDKKPNFLNFIEGRGISVWADIHIPNNIILSILKTTPEKFIEVVERKLVYGSILSGSIGSNAHMANVLSAIFLATGQDIAHISECAAGITTAEKTKDGLYVSIYLPDLVVGTVGGGTNLVTQKESLSIIGLDGGNNGENSTKFAEIIAGSVLAGEISLIASLAEGSLVKAHKKLGRGGSNY
jgi:hydroxymethylglutaryl-CoA reductase (NADPH)